jgi:acetyltransferase-like isoleucine patch superfamily enzyme
MRNVTIVKTSLGESSTGWKQKKSVISVSKNWILAWLAGKMPGASNQFFYRKMGIKIGKNVQIMPGIRMDIFFPELIKINDNVVIGQEAFIACHEFNVNEFRFGPITIGKNVLIGARAFLLPGIEIGDNAIIPANTTIYKSVPKNNIAFGSPLAFKNFKTKKKK